MASDLDRRKEALAAERAARRSSPEFAEAGAALLAKKAKDEAERRAAEERARRIDEEERWEYRTWQVPAGKLDDATDDFLERLDESSSDSGADKDSIALDVMDSYLLAEVLVGKPTSAKVALALELLRTQFAFSVREGLDHLGRIGR